MLTRMDKYHMALAEICGAINYRANFVVWEHTFSPKEYLAAELERRFARYESFWLQNDLSRQIEGKDSY